MDRHYCLVVHSVQILTEKDLFFIYLFLEVQHLDRHYCLVHSVQTVIEKNL